MAELVSYRELLYLLVWRDIKVRYKQTFLGAAWAVLQPVLTTVVFSVFLGGLGKIPSDGVPYPVFTLAALVPWTFFANGLMLGSNSLVQNAALVTKIYFPRLLMPLAAVIAGLLDLAIGFVVLGALMAWYGIVPGWHLLLAPLLIVLVVITAAGISTAFAAMNVRYRDVRYVVPFLTQLWLFVTPIAYPTSLVSSRWRALEGLNPMAGVVEGFRAVLLSTKTDATPVVAVSVVTSLVLFAAGLLYFLRVERTFADVV